MEESLLYTRLVTLQLRPFGEIVQTVGSFIAARGPQTIGSLVQGLQLGHSIKKIKEALLVLTSQRFIAPRSSSSAGASTQIFYSLSRQGVIEHLLHPLIIEEVQLHTEASLSQDALSLFIRTIMNGGSILTTEEGPSSRQHLECLVAAGFLKCDSNDDPSAEDEKKAAFALAKDKKRPQVTGNDEYAMMIYSQIHPSEPSSVAKRIKVTLSPVLHVNWDLFRFRFQSRWLIDFFSTRIHQSAGAIMKIILDKLESSSVAISSTRITLFEIVQNLSPDASSVKVGQSTQGPATSSSIVPNITSLILLMIDSSMDILHRHKDESELSVGLNLNAMKRASKTLLCEKYIQDRFGDNSLRIFRLLGLKQLLEEKQISKFAMLSLKDVRERLFQLHKNGFVSIQEVPRTLDFAPSRTIFLWKHAADSRYPLSLRCLQAIVNCLERATLEVDTNNPSNAEILESHASSVIANMAPILLWL